MKKSTTRPSQTLDIYPPDYTAGAAMDKSGAPDTANVSDLAGLVWKYFGEEITQALQEAQQALAPAKGRSTATKSRKR